MLDEKTLEQIEAELHDRCGRGESEARDAALIVEAINYLPALLDALERSR